jgi:hypothetical protein
MRRKKAFSPGMMECSQQTLHHAEENAVPAITLDHPFLRKHQELVHGVLSCFDRVILRGHLTTYWPLFLSPFLPADRIQRNRCCSSSTGRSSGGRSASDAYRHDENGPRSSRSPSRALRPVRCRRA